MSAEVLGLPAGGAAFDFGGRSYPLPAEVNYQDEAHFSVWLRGRAARAVEEQRRHLGEQWAQEHMRGWREDCAAGRYDFGQPASVSAILLSDAGMQELCWLLLDRAAGGGVPRALLDEVWASRADRERLAALVWGLLDPLGRGWLATSPADPPSASTPPPSSNPSPTAAATAGTNSAGCPAATPGA